MIVMDFGDSFAPSLAAAGTLARTASGFAAKEKPLRSEVVRERSSSCDVLLSKAKMTEGHVLLVQKS
jgi:hypothetical protein